MTPTLYCPLCNGYPRRERVGPTGRRKQWTVLVDCCTRCGMMTPVREGLQAGVEDWLHRSNRRCSGFFVNEAIRQAFACFEAVFVRVDVDTTHVYVVSDHSDQTYEALATAEDNLAAKVPGLLFEVSVRDPRGRPASAVVPSGATRL